MFGSSTRDAFDAPIDSESNGKSPRGKPHCACYRDVDDLVGAGGITIVTPSTRQVVFVYDDQLFGAAMLEGPPTELIHR